MTAALALVTLAGEMKAKTTMNRRTGLLITALMLLLTITAAAEQVYLETRLPMGTFCTISLWLDDADQAKKAFDAAFERVDQVDRLFSTYKKSSDLSGVNREADKKPVVVSDEVFGLLSRALEAGRLSGGAFDITFKGLGLWNFTEPLIIPTDEQIAQRLPLIDYRQVTLNDEQKTVSFSRDGMAIGLGGMAKGYGIDQAAYALAANGCRNFIVNIGGDMLVSGSKGKEPWRIGIQDPRGDRDSSLAVISGYSGAVVTSGDYERFFIKDGVRYHHILDPRTGKPARGLVSVTVIAPTAEQADWLATAVFVLGEIKGPALIDSFPQAQCLLITEDDRRIFSAGFKKAVAIHFR